VKPPGPAEQGPAWDGAAPAWRLALGTEPPGEGPTWPADPPGLVAGHRVLVDGRSLVGWDTGLAARLWPRVRAWRAAGIEVDLSALPPGLQHLLDLASGPGVTTPNEAPVRVPDSLLAFVGEVALALGRWVGGRGGPRAADVLQQLDETGPRSAPIVLLACALVSFFTVAAGFFEMLLADPLPGVTSDLGLGSAATLLWHGLGGVLLLMVIVLMTVWRGFQRFRWRRDMGRQVQWLYLLAGLALFPVMGLHGTLGAELAAEFGVHISADQLLAAGANLQEALP
jgi:uncharacterized membrane protein